MSMPFLNCLCQCCIIFPSSYIGFNLRVIFNRAIFSCSKFGSICSDTSYNGDRLRFVNFISCFFHLIFNRKLFSFEILSQNKFSLLFASDQSSPALLSTLHMQLPQSVTLCRICEIFLFVLILCILCITSFDNSEEHSSRLSSTTFSFTWSI